MKVMPVSIVTQKVQKMINKHCTQKTDCCSPIRYVRHKIWLTLLLISFLSISMYAQDQNDMLSGKVSFKSSQNVYVKFNSTTDIQAGDTLLFHIDGKLEAALVVVNKSSTSCVCYSITSTPIAINQEIFARRNQPVRESRIKKVQAPKQNELVSIDVDSSQVVTPENRNRRRLSESVTGKIAAASYSNFSKVKGGDSQRYRYTLSLRTKGLAKDKLELETYLSFRHKEGEWNEVEKNLNSALKVYRLSAAYRFSENLKLSIGRRINRMVSNIGASDGLHLEGKINNFILGGTIGTRPDYTDYSFNPDLLQYGVYVGHTFNREKRNMKNSLALFEQKNSGKTDRRFAYFQHQNHLFKKLYLFTSFEMDLFKNTGNSSKSDFRLTGFYFLARYRPGKKLSISGSYDARKRVIYYETYKSYIDQLLDEESRQGYRLRVNYKPLKWINIGVNGSYRFRADDPKASTSLHSYATIRARSANSISTTVSATRLTSSYFNSDFYGVRISKPFYQGKMHTSISYRKANYFYLAVEENLIQDIYEISLYWSIIKKLSFSANYELVDQGEEGYSRVYLQLRKRF
jgi:hypothetical protein